MKSAKQSSVVSETGMKTGSERSPPVFTMVISSNYNSSAISGNSLSRLDPRLKLLLVIVAIAAVFASTSWLQLFLLMTVGFSLLLLLESLSLLRQRLYWLRWFFLFVIFLHMLLSPGYTLFGLAWLSYDGLLRGLQISLQVVTALAFSLALSRSTTPGEMTAAAAAILRPLNLLGLNVKDFSRQILLTLHLVPILREESAEALQQIENANPEEKFSGLSCKIAKLQLLVMPLLSGLIERADAMAHESAAGRDPYPEAVTLSSFWPLARAELLTLALSVLVFMIYRGLL